MQDWLNDRGLDRKTLQALASNVAAVEEYEAHAYVEVQACMHSMLDLFGPPRQLVCCPHCLSCHLTASELPALLQGHHALWLCDCAVSQYTDSWLLFLHGMLHFGCSAANCGWTMANWQCD